AIKECPLPPKDSGGAQFKSAPHLHGRSSWLPVFILQSDDARRLPAGEDTSNSASNLVRHVSKDEKFTSLVGNIYDAALEPAQWFSVLERIAEYVGGQGAGLLSKDSISRSANAHYYTGVDPHFIDIFPEWSQIDPMATLPLVD